MPWNSNAMPMPIGMASSSATGYIAMPSSNSNAMLDPEGRVAYQEYSENDYKDTVSNSVCTATHRAMTTPSH